MKQPRIHEALAALIASAVAGGLATAVGIVLAMVIPSYANGLPSFTDVVTGAMLVVVMMLWLGTLTTCVFAVGLLVVGVPAWAALYRLGFRSRRTAAVAGALLAATTIAALALAMGGPGSGVIWLGPLMLLPGAVAGWTLHRVAYGKATPA